MYYKIYDVKKKKKSDWLTKDQTKSIQIETNSNGHIIFFTYIKLNMKENPIYAKLLTKEDKKTH